MILQYWTRSEKIALSSVAVSIVFGLCALFFLEVRQFIGLSTSNAAIPDGSAKTRTQASTREGNTTASITQIQSEMKPSRTGETAQQPITQIADGLDRLMSLTPAEVGSIGWNNQSCDSELLFASTKHKTNWAKVEINGFEHFATFYIGLTDSQGGLDNRILSTAQVRKGQVFIFRTSIFKATVIIDEAITGDDPDPVKPYPSVFKSLTLRVRVQEIR